MAIIDRNVTPPRPDSSPAHGEVAPSSAASVNTNRFRRIMSQIPGPLIGLIVIFVALSFLSPYFLTPRNLLNILSQVSAVGVMSVGALLIILLGGIDLSVGSVLALSSMSMAAMYKMAGWPFEVALLAGLIVGALVGLINGILTAYGKLQPFIATLATMSAAAGLALFITNGNPSRGSPTGSLRSQLRAFSASLSRALFSSQYSLLRHSG